ncbi:MAG: YybH family protein [Vicinamibacterales bacterium]
MIRFLDIMDSDVTYFDPVQEQRVDGLPAMKRLLEPFTGKISIDRYEMINPKVQLDGNVAVLTFNLVNYRRQPDGAELILNRWNSTEIYRQTNGSWKLMREHWSYIKPPPNP